MPSVLAVNAGSSTLKAALFSTEGRAVGDEQLRSRVPSGVGGAWLVQQFKGLAKGDAIGHRVVHGGPRFVAPMRISAELLDELRRISPFDPEHLPAQIALIEACAEGFPGVCQVACFDTAFHQDL